MRTFYLALVVKPVDTILEPESPGDASRLIVVKQPGDPFGFVPAFESEEDARRAYPRATIIPVQEAT